MTQISELLAEVRRLREGVEGIKQLLARVLEPPHSRPGELRYVPTIGAVPSWVCGNGMHLHRTAEEAVACMKENRPFRMKDGEIVEPKP